MMRARLCSSENIFLFAQINRFEVECDGASRRLKSRLLKNYARILTIICAYAFYLIYVEAPEKAVKSRIYLCDWKIKRHLSIVTRDRPV